MADDQRDEQDEQQQGDQGTETGKGGARGDDDKPGAALLKALNEERDARRKAESALRKREQADKDAETQRAIKAGEWESVAKAKDSEIADLTTRIGELEAEIATSKLETVRERVANKHKLPPALAARLRGGNEAELEADAKDLAKLIVVKAPDTELGKGNGSGNGKVGHDELVQRMVASGKWNI